MDKIAEITNSEFRTGVSKTGKPWTLMLVKTDTGKEASVFTPAQVGDPVKLTYNEQYKNYSAEVITAKKMEAVIKEEQQDELLQTIKTNTEKILSLLEHQVTNTDEPPF